MHPNRIVSRVASLPPWQIPVFGKLWKNPIFMVQNNSYLNFWKFCENWPNFSKFHWYKNIKDHALSDLNCLYSGKYRPACRIIQTGVRSTFSPRAARITKSFFNFGKSIFTLKWRFCKSATSGLVKTNEANKCQVCYF